MRLRLLEWVKQAEDAAAAIILVDHLAESGE
jgi:hypothetical protein